MITISKPLAIPQILESKGKAENTINCRRKSRNPLSTIVIKSSIYGHTSVKKILKKAQYNKCCFCEKEQVDEFGAVEHFRPKNGYKSHKVQKLLRPGYYWLGYNWENLFFVCNACNGAGNKGNLFPLVDESTRAKSHIDNIAMETPKLLDPSGRKNPRNHISFVDEIPKSLSIYGKKTIEICGLDRDPLNEMRRKLISDIDARIAILSLGIHSQDTIDKAKSFIKNVQMPQAEFSAMATDYITRFFIL